MPAPSPPLPSPVAQASQLAALRDARFRDGLRCPRCGCEAVHGWGRCRGRQRYRCRGCRRTFSDLTGTPAAYAKKLGLWGAYARCLAEGLSVRGAAARLGVHPTTAFRWRHRLLDALRERDGERLAGWIELDVLGCVVTATGQRVLPRARWVPGGERGPRGVVLLACDRGGGVVTGAAGERRALRVGPGEWETGLAGRVGGRPILTAAQGPLGPVATLARRRGARFRDARWGLRLEALERGETTGVGRRVGPGEAGAAGGLAHVRTVRAYGLRLVVWMERFRGVAPHYLPNYLVWHREVERSRRLGLEAQALRWPLAAAAR